jgi:ribose transport system permease protein
MAVELNVPIRQQEHSYVSWLLSRQAFWVFLALIAACIFLSFATNSFATPNKLFNITRNFTFVAIISLGMTIVIITGGIDLSVGSVLCLCSMILAVVMHNGYGIEMGIAASLGTALFVGAINGVLSPISALSICRNPVCCRCPFAGNGRLQQHRGVPVRPDQSKLSSRRRALGSGFRAQSIHVILALITGFILRWTRFGRYVLRSAATRGGDLTGVQVRRIKSRSIVSALSAGIAGSSKQDGSAVTTNLGAGMELQVIAATVIGGANLAGGVGTAFGALVGSALIEVIRNSLGLLGINAFWQGAFVGAFIIIAVSFEYIRNLRQSE